MEEKNMDSLKNARTKYYEIPNIDLLAMNL